MGTPLRASRTAYGSALACAAAHTAAQSASDLRGDSSAARSRARSAPTSPCDPSRTLRSVVSALSTFYQDSHNPFDEKQRHLS
ncbi:hypothetical protein AB0C77_23530, partial [Streptomyces sp. NPDC048629]|uniref:hypothetical protein n=1 Tax=Streptomyces sp. NPDC048629 TaxID=3154824 RepID=UPI0034414A0A